MEAAGSLGHNKLMIVRIVDSVPGGGADWQDWEAPAAKLTLRELIAERVRREVGAFNQNRPEVYHGLVAPEESERLLNGYRLKRLRELDAEQEVERAFRAFERNGFLVFASGRQIESLDAEIDLAAGGKLEFIKLLPLAGG
jgi:hypothetical protein